MAFNLQGGYGAGGGADMLQQILKQKALEFAQAEQLKLDKQRMSIEQQRATSDDELRRMAMEDRRTAQGAAAKEQARTGAMKLAGTKAIGQDLDPSSVESLTAGGMGDTVKGPTLGSRNIGQNFTSTPNPGHGQTYLGTAGQQADKAQEDELDRQITLATPERRGRLQMARVLDPDKRAGAITEVMREEAKPAPRSPAYQEYQDAVASGYKGDFNKYQTEDANRKKSAAPTIVVQTVDANGNNVTKVVPKTAGAEYAKPKGANAPLENRLASARVVNQIGDHMVQQLSDPAFANVVGPAMGRAGTLRDFIGNPPPEFSELAGQIESYALANMGVHGMRSAQGAEQIKRLLDQHHTPQSLAATIRGLNEFSTRLVKDSEPKGSGANTGPKRVRYDMNGNPIKD